MTNPSPKEAPQPPSIGALSAPETLRRRIQTGLLQGFSTAITAVLAFTVANRLGLQESYWAAISAIVVMQSGLSDTVNSARDRLVGTAIGALIGWGCALVWHRHIAVYGAAVFLAMFTCWALRLGSAGRLCGVTVSIITLITHVGRTSEVALHRFLDVSLGILVSVAVSLLLDRAAKAFAHHRTTT